MFLTKDMPLDTYVIFSYAFNFSLSRFRVVPPRVLVKRVYSSEVSTESIKCLIHGIEEDIGDIPELCESYGEELVDWAFYIPDIKSFHIVTDRDVPLLVNWVWLSGELKRDLFIR